jgi:uroporphyrinogen decarboxylase
MTGREVVYNAVRFKGPGRLPLSLPDPYGNDFAGVSMDPHPDARPANGRDEWGAIWKNIGVCRLGEVQDFPLKDWADFDRLSIPDVEDPRRWTSLEGVRERAGDKFLLGSGISLYERIHFIRGLENTWADIYTNPNELRGLLNALVEMNVKSIRRYAEAGCDGYFWCDDWGLQDRLMISPDKWREIWKPAYARVYRAAHDAGMLTFLHSCGHIVDILDDLIEIGLDVIQMDQQENMGLEHLSKRFAGRITFWCPVDIQNTMCRGSLEDIRAYARKMVKLLGRPEGGFITQWYADPVGAGHSQEAVDAMCDEFLKISREMYG